MNERIEKLFEQALEEFKAENKYATIIVPNPLKEKYAELILLEVTDILSTYRGKMVFEDGAEYNHEHPIIAIRKHFGVEE